MILVWGSRLYGKVDEVPGVFYVATKFGHLWYLPLIPLGSHVVFREHEDGWDGLPISMSTKSVLVAWTRAALVLGGIWSAVSMAIDFAMLDVFGGLFDAIGLALAGGLFFLTKRLAGIVRCDPDRARKIAAKAGFDEAGLALLETHLLAREAAQPIVPR